MALAQDGVFDDIFYTFFKPDVNRSYPYCEVRGSGYQMDPNLASALQIFADGSRCFRFDRKEDVACRVQRKNKRKGIRRFLSREATDGKWERCVSFGRFLNAEV